MIDEEDLMRPHRTIFSCLLLSTFGCTSAPRQVPYSTLPSTSTSSAERARAANEEGLRWAMTAETPRAERAFRDALSYDPAYAAAHNNLGLILLEKRRFYEAAIEFSLAKKLAPRAVEPRLNLARLYQSVGWDKPALSECEAALALAPGHPEVLGRMAEAALRAGNRDRRVEVWLSALANQSAAEDWHAWAQGQLARSSNIAE